MIVFENHHSLLHQLNMSFICVWQIEHKFVHFLNNFTVSSLKIYLFKWVLADLEKERRNIISNNKASYLITTFLFLKAM